MINDVRVALLRGINVGGHGKLPMADLRALLNTLGARDVVTYIQSGNAVFRGDVQGREISEAIAAGHGFKPRVLVMGAEGLDAAVRANPFPGAEAEPKNLHLYFADAPLSANAGALNAACNGVERWQIIGPVCYLHSPGGLSRSKLADKLERLLGVPVTARNWNTVARLRDMTRAF